MDYSPQIAEAARLHFPEAKDEEIGQYYNQIKQELATQGHPGSDEEIIDVFNKVAPKVKEQMGMGPGATPGIVPVSVPNVSDVPNIIGMGDVEKASQDYAKQLADLKMGRKGQESISRYMDVWSQGNPNQELLQNKWKAEDAMAKESTIGAFQEKLKSKKDIMDLNNAELDAKAKRENADPTSARSKAARDLLRSSLIKQGRDINLVKDNMSADAVQQISTINNTNIDNEVKVSAEKRASAKQEHDIQYDKDKLALDARQVGQADARLNLEKDKFNLDAEKQRGTAEEQKADSDISKFIRDNMKAAGLTVPENMTAAQARLSGFDVDKFMTYRQQSIKPTDAQKEVAKKTESAKDVLSLLTQASPIVPEATSSGLGNWIDNKLATVGISLEGADNAAKLKAISGLLVSKMPRMEGPQSNLDVDLYKEMAGKIGDPTTPVSQKEAAMETIREINQRYLTNQGVNVPDSGLPTVKTQADLDKLPKGTTYIGHDGVKRVRK